MFYKYHSSGLIKSNVSANKINYYNTVHQQDNKHHESDFSPDDHHNSTNTKLDDHQLSLKRLKKLLSFDNTFLSSVFDTSFVTNTKMIQSNTCLYCATKFTDVQQLKAHYFSHIFVPIFVCDICKEEFLDKIKLQDHIIQHQLDITFTCNVCSKSFSDSDQLKIHEISQQHGLVIPLDPASAQTLILAKTASLAEHMNFSVAAADAPHTNLNSINDLCIDTPGILYQTSGGNNNTLPPLHHESQSMECHQETFTLSHSTNPIFPFLNRTQQPQQQSLSACPSSPAALLIPNPNLIHTICEVCGKGFDRKDKCEVHYQLYHSKKAPFYCSFCRAASLRNFTNRSKDPSTRDTYGGRQINPVSGAFDRKILLLKHLKRYHKNVYKRGGGAGAASKKYYGGGGVNTTFRCQWCRGNVSFTQERLLQEHIRYHHPHQESHRILPTSSSSAAVLEDEESCKKFPCQVCGSLFRQIASVNHHVRRYHPEVPEVERILLTNEIHQNESLLFATESDYVDSNFMNYLGGAAGADSGGVGFAPVANLLDYFTLQDDSTFCSGPEERSDNPHFPPANGDLDYLKIYPPVDYSLDHDRVQQRVEESSLFPPTQSILCSICGLIFSDDASYHLHLHEASSNHVTYASHHRLESAAVATRNNNNNDGVHGGDRSFLASCDEETYECTHCFFLTRNVPIFNAHFQTDFHFHRQNNLLLYDSFKRLFPTPSIATKLHSGKISTISMEVTELGGNDTSTVTNNYDGFLLGYNCLVCETRFTDRSNLERHVIVHGAVLPYSCYVCGQAFVIVENLRKHWLLHFTSLKGTINEFSAVTDKPCISNSNRRYHCVACQITFHDRSSYQVHECIPPLPLPTPQSFLENDYQHDHQQEEDYTKTSYHAISAGALNRCQDCGHAFIDRNLYVGHICLGYSPKIPAYPFLDDYGLESAQTQILGNYMPIPANQCSVSSGGVSSASHPTIGTTFPPNIVLNATEHEMSLFDSDHHDFQRSSMSMQLLEETGGGFGFGSFSNHIFDDLNFKTVAGASTISPNTAAAVSSSSASNYITAPIEIPEQLKFAPFSDPFSSRPISSENPWDEYWPKIQQVSGGGAGGRDACQLSVCSREYAFYQSVFYSDDRNPIKIPVLHFKRWELTAATKVYCCEACNQSFRERKVLEEHIVGIHFQNMPPHYFLCHSCGKFSRAGRAFRVHLERHHHHHLTENKFLCDQCPVSFTSKNQLKSHYQQCHDPATAVVTTSDMLLLNDSAGPGAGGSGPPFTCNMCLSLFMSRAELSYHVFSTHPAAIGEIKQQQQPYVCTVCSKTYTKRSKLLEHVKIHHQHTGERPFKCYSCHECFAHRKILQEHVAMMHGNQNYKCKHCDKTYSYEPHLIRHMKIHSGQNPYTCHVCDRDFYRKEKLQRHLFVHDVNTLHKCDVCHKGYSTREVLEKHICVREKGCENIVFKCPLCPRKFTFKKNLELHIAHHQPNEVRNDRKKVPKQYYCNLCPKAFVHLKKLNRHLLFHQKYPNFEGGIPIIVEEKKFKCHLCPKTFIKNFYLKKHLENHYKYATSTRRPKNAAAYLNNLSKQGMLLPHHLLHQSSSTTANNNHHNVIAIDPNQFTLLQGSSFNDLAATRTPSASADSGSASQLHNSASGNMGGVLNFNDVLLIPINELNSMQQHNFDSFTQNFNNPHPSATPNILSASDMLIKNLRQQHSSSSSHHHHHNLFLAASGGTSTSSIINNNNHHHQPMGGIEAQLYLNNITHNFETASGSTDYNSCFGTIDANAFLNDLITPQSSNATFNPTPEVSGKQQYINHINQQLSLSSNHIHNNQNIISSQNLNQSFNNFTDDSSSLLDHSSAVDEPTTSSKYPTSNLFDQLSHEHIHNLVDAAFNNNDNNNNAPSLGRSVAAAAHHKQSVNQMEEEDIVEDDLLVAGHSTAPHDHDNSGSHLHPNYDQVRSISNESEDSSPNPTNSNSMYTLMRIQDDGSLTHAHGTSIEDNQTLIKVIEQLQQQQDGVSETTPSLIIIQTDN